MTQILKQSTAVDVLIGPFVDKTDGATAETGESPSVKLSKNGQALAAKSDVTTPVHDADGYYNCELDATDTNTVGTLVLTVAASANALPVRHEYQVVEEAIYDALFGASAAGFDANGRVDVGSWLGTAVTTSATTAKPEVDANSVSDSATAANNLEANIGNLDAAVSSRATPAQVNTEVDNALNTAIPVSPVADSINERIATLDDNYTAARAANLDNADATVSSRATPAQVNTEVSDVLKTDTITLPGQAAPPASPTFEEALSWLYKVFRNRKRQTASEWQLMDDAETTVDAKATVSDDGTTAIKQEVVAGP